MTATVSPSSSSSFSSGAPRKAHPIVPRSLDVDLSKVPRHWLGGSIFASQVANGVNALFPAGERFFVRSVRAFESRIQAPTLLEQVKGFYGQEGRHAHAHEAAIDLLEEQGYPIRAFLSVYETIAYDWLERALPAELALATTVAAEHFTAMMAEGSLAIDALKTADPEMRKLLYWHAAEEIEHKAVAFDVLREVNPSYALRMAGLGVATTLLGAFWMAATSMLLVEDARRFGVAKLRADVRKAKRHRAREGRKSIAREVFLAGILKFTRRDFHPWDEDHGEAARRVLDSLRDRLRSAAVARGN